MRVGSSYYVNSNVDINSKPKNELDINDFLQIMVAEIQSMNPLSGDNGSKTDYISQMTQFTTLEQMSDIAEGMRLLNLMGQQQYSFSLIGKEVSLAHEGEIITGVVDRVKFQYGNILLQVNDEEYYLGDVIEAGNVEVENEL